MGKKLEDAEVKKECPSCGLGVALDSTVCEFCGWDFEEEDEWILQIEKLERDLMLEKQKFEPGTVNQKIESTLHNPSIERIEIIRARQDHGVSEPTAASASEARSPARTEAAKAVPTPPPVPAEKKGMREARPSEMEIRKAPAPIAEERADMPKPVSARFARDAIPEAKPVVQLATTKVRRVRTIKAPRSIGDQAESSESGQLKTKLMRKVKK